MQRYLSKIFFHSKFVPYALLALIPLVVFWRVLIGTHIFGLGDFSGSDLLELHLPFKYILHESYTHGQIPLWTTYLSNGFPVLAEGQSGALYPANILLAFLPPVISLNYSIVLAFIVAGWGGYLFARTLPEMNRFGAIVCGVVFMFSSFFIARMKHLNMIVVAAYLPWCLWSIRNAFGNGTTLNFKWFVFLGIFWALQLLAGHPHMFYLCFIMCSWYFCAELLLIFLKKDSSYVYKSITAIFCFFVAALISMGLSAAQLLPTYELTRLSTRQNFTYQVATDYPLRPPFLSSFFAPFFMGNPATGSYRGIQNIHIDGIWWENVLYIGLFPFIVICVYILNSIKRLVQGSSHKFKQLSLYTYYYWFFIVSMIVFLLLAMGDFSFLFPVLYYNLPGMNLFRFPNRFTLFTLFSLSVLAGWSIQRLSYRLERSRVEGALKRTDSSDYVFSWPLQQFATKLLFVILIVLDLAVFTYQYVEFFPVSEYLKPVDLVKELRKDTSLFRIYPTTQYVDNPFGTIGWKSKLDTIYALQKAIPGNFSAIYKFDSFTDRGWFEGGLGVKERMTLENLITKNELTPEIFSKILALWNVKYIIGFSDFPEPYFAKYKEYTLTKSFSAPLYVYENLFVYPRAYFSPVLIHSDNEDKMIENIMNEPFSSQIRAFTLEKGKGILLESDEASAAATPVSEGSESAKISVTSYTSQRVSVRSETTKEGIVVLSDTYYPGWKAYVDGKESPIVKVNLVQRGVEVGKGTHNIVWIYEPWSFFIGLGISIATAITLISGFCGSKLLRFGRGKRHT